MFWVHHVMRRSICLVFTSLMSAKGLKNLLLGRQVKYAPLPWPNCVQLSTRYSARNIHAAIKVDTPNETPEEDCRKFYFLKGATMEGNRSGVSVATRTGHSLTTDLPRNMGGKDSAAQPVETLLTALIGCTQATALFVGRNMRPNRLLIERLEFDLSADRDERGAIALPIEESPSVPSRLQRVSGSIHVYAIGGARIDHTALELLKEQTEVRCPVANMMIASGCEMEIEWIDGSDQ